MKVTNLFTEKDREVFDRIDRDCLAMHVVPPPKTFLNLKVVGADGETLETYSDRAHSYTRNFYNVVFSGNFALDAQVTGFGAGYLQLKTSAGTLFDTTQGYARLLKGTLGAAFTGIAIGTGSDAESFDSYKFTAKIANGTSAGQMVHNAMETGVPTYDSGTKKWTSLYTRTFNNNSGGSIDVAEVGFVTPQSSIYILNCRDVLASAVTVPNAGQLTVTYTIEMTFPA